MPVAPILEAAANATAAAIAAAPAQPDLATPTANSTALSDVVP
jgi:hypothetical protein